MTDTSEPIAYTALKHGTPVQTNDGHVFAKVETVLVVEEVDVFDGIVVGTDHGVRFVDADNVAAIFTTHVETTLSLADAETLPKPDQDAMYDVDASDDAGGSIADRFGRMFGRGKWKREH
ncbi:MAG TPA: hypothetical protein VFE15_07640 [Marmoricola sp.]|jgi:hypothetical protein|nr:hypothetical protein [Marmoricola sp.]